MTGRSLNIFIAQDQRFNLSTLEASVEIFVMELICSAMFPEESCSFFAKRPMIPFHDNATTNKTAIEQ